MPRSARAKEQADVEAQALSVPLPQSVRAKDQADVPMTPSRNTSTCPVTLGPEPAVKALDDQSLGPVTQNQAFQPPPGLQLQPSGIPKSFQAQERLEHQRIYTPREDARVQALQDQIPVLTDTVRMLSDRMLILQNSAPPPPTPPPGRPPSGSPQRVPQIANFMSQAAGSSGFLPPPPGTPPSSSSSSSSSSSLPKNMGSKLGRCRICGGNHEDVDCPFLSMNQTSEVDYAEHEESVVRIKSLNDWTFPNPPQDAGAVRGYINQALMAIGKLQKTSGAELYQWAQQCLDMDEEVLAADPRFPRTNREIAANLLKTCRSGRFGLMFQRMVEECRARDGSMPNGRVMLRSIFKHFQLERDMIGMLGERNLLSLTMSGQKVNDLYNFRERYNYIMMAIPHQDLPKEATLYNHLLDELEKFKLLSEKVTKSREAPAGSSKRTTKWLWDKVDLLIELEQNKTNRAAFDKKLQGNPHDIAIHANPAPADKAKKDKSKKFKAKNRKEEKENAKEPEPGKPKGSTPRNTPRKGSATEAIVLPLHSQPVQARSNRNKETRTKASH